MSTEINRLIVFLMHPYGVGIGLLFIGLVLAVLRKKSRAYILLAAVLWLWLWSTWGMVFVLGMPLESPYAPKSVEAFPESDLIHILGGGLSCNTSSCVYAEMASSADRAWQGARLYHAGKAHRILCTGGGLDCSTVPLLVDLGVPRDKILLRDASNTEDEARKSDEVLQATFSNGVPRVLLVTSAWHMRRAEFLFKNVSKCSITPAAADYEITTRFSPSHKLTFFNLLPDAGALAMNGVMVKEHVAYWGYRLKYWLKGLCPR